jgi:deoxyxylulose-5-phosphate synthase
VIDSIAAHPPVGAMSKNKQTLLKMNPYTSVRKFVNQLVKERRNQFYTDEAAMVAQAEGTVVNSVVESLKKKGFEYVVGKSPHLAKV